MPKVLKQANLMDYNKRFDQIESILADVLRVQDRLVSGQEQLVKGQEQLVKGQEQLVAGQEQLVAGQEHHTQLLTRQARAVEQLVELGRTHHEIMAQHTEVMQGHTGLFQTLVEQVVGLRGDIAKIADFNDRLNALEQAVFKKGA